ncbi:MAG: molybdopterin converting factor subunit 1 [Pseudomonadota bacterium]
MNSVKLVYFAWVRERVGTASEDVMPPETVRTVADLIAWLRSRGPEYENAFSEPAVIRTAIDQMHVAPDTLITGAREIAFFPPVTGG